MYSVWEKVEMSQSISHPLPYELRIRAERLTGEDFSKVTYEISDVPHQQGTFGYTDGERMYLSPHVFSLPYNDIIEIFGHELTRIMQHRARDVQGSFHADMIDVEYIEIVMEHEAHKSGNAFANGSLSAFHEITPKFMNSNPIQTYVILGEKWLSSVNELSDSAILLLGFIRQGNDWFNWALKQQTHRYSFSDEYQLVDSVQYGLHGNNLISILPSELIVNPARLLHISLVDMKLLAKEATSQEDNKIVDLSVSKMLVTNGLRVKSDLIVGVEFLKQVGVADAVIFQAMSLNDLIDLFDMVNDATTSSSLDTSIQKEAAGFALDKAKFALEFFDLYRFYISLADKLGNQVGTPEKRSALAAQYLEEITIVLFETGLCPIVEQDHSPAVLRSLIQNRVDGGQDIGFNSLSRGVSQVMQGTQLGKLGKNLVVADTTKQYLSDAQNFIKLNEAGVACLSQDGLSNTYTINSKTATAVLEVNQQGLLTLEKYQIT